MDEGPEAFEAVMEVWLPPSMAALVLDSAPASLQISTAHAVDNPVSESGDTPLEEPQAGPLTQAAGSLGEASSSDLDPHCYASDDLP